MRTPRVRLEVARERFGRARERMDASAAGQLQRRVTELALMNQALILAALALMLFVPALITLGALLPLGSSGGTAAAAAHRVGLSPAATHDLQLLLPSRKVVRAATTGGGAVLTLLFTYSWPATLARGYEAIWDLPPRGRRDLWRNLVWLVVFFPVVVAAGALGELTHGIGAVWSPLNHSGPLIRQWTFLQD